VEFVWEVPLRMSNFGIWSIFLVSGTQYNYQKCHQICSTLEFAEQNSRNFSRNLFERYPKDSKFQNSEYEVHQVGPKHYGSQNFSFITFLGTELVSIQISATATARDRRKIFYRANLVF
jgi:hypothetical protein